MTPLLFAITVVFNKPAKKIKENVLKNFKILISILILLLSTNCLYSDSDGYFCTTENIIAYEFHFDHPDKLFLQFFGNNTIEEKTYTIVLPRKMTMNLYSMTFVNDTLNIVLRDIKNTTNENKKKTRTDSLFFYKYLINDKNDVKLCSNEAKIFENMEISRPKNNLGLWSRNGIKSLESTDSEFTYILKFDSKVVEKKKISKTTGYINHEHTTKLIMKNKKGEEVQNKEIFKGIFTETID